VYCALCILLSFKGHFPDGPGLVPKFLNSGFYWCKRWWRWLWQLRL